MDRLYCLVAIGIIQTILGIAGVAKLLDLAAFRDSLRSWTLVPTALADVLSVGVPVFELGVAGLWLLNVQRHRCVLAAGAMLVVFTAAYALHWIFVDPPNCECFGKILAYNNDKSAAVSIVVRNVLLLSVLVVASFRPATAVTTSLPSPSVHAEVHQRGFTLIEAILVIAIIALLITMIAPKFKYFREKARDARVLAAMHSHVQSFTSYATDYKEVWPYLTNPKATWTVLRDEGIQVPVRYFDVCTFWHVPLAVPLYASHWTDPVFQPERPPSSGVRGAVAGIWYSPTFLADPLFFDPLTRTDRSQWRPTRTDEVTFPSNKALFLAGNVWVDRQLAQRSGTPLAFVDGSAADVPDALLGPLCPTGAGTEGTDWLISGFPGLTTLHGVRGRDRR